MFCFDLPCRLAVSLGVKPVTLAVWTHYSGSRSTEMGSDDQRISVSPPSERLQTSSTRHFRVGIETRTQIRLRYLNWAMRHVASDDRPLAARLCLLYTSDAADE